MQESGVDINSMSRSYRIQSAKIRLRLNKVKSRLQNGNMAEEEQYCLRQEQTMLTAMYRELSETSKYLEHYYDADARLYGDYSMSGIRVSSND